MKLDDGIEVELQLPGEDDMSGEHERAAGLARKERPKIDRSVSGRQSCSITGPYVARSTPFLWLIYMTEMDSGTESDSKANGYIVLCRTCSHCTNWDSDLYSLFLCRQESECESESIPESVSGNVNEPL